MSTMEVARSLSLIKKKQIVLLVKTQIDSHVATVWHASLRGACN